ncbi:MAG TPA: hypothetical protein VEG61_08415 [Candidatus Dormibacteraeota bacterium]|nr:hypothetical protein [Candidatus Dormibacteraeota bacterium]
MVGMPGHREVVGYCPYCYRLTKSTYVSARTDGMAAGIGADIKEGQT